MCRSGWTHGQLLYGHADRTSRKIIRDALKLAQEAMAARVSIPGVHHEPYISLIWDNEDGGLREGYEVRWLLEKLCDMFATQSTIHLWELEKRENFYFLSRQKHDCMIV